MNEREKVDWDKFLAAEMGKFFELTFIWKINLSEIPIIIFSVSDENLLKLYKFILIIPKKSSQCHSLDNCRVHGNENLIKNEGNFLIYYMSILWVYMYFVLCAEKVAKERREKINKKEVNTHTHTHR